MFGPDSRGIAAAKSHSRVPQGVNTQADRYPLIDFLRLKSTVRLPCARSSRKAFRDWNLDSFDRVLASSTFPGEVEPREEMKNHG